VPALILPLYYLVDATATMMRRLVCGETIWQAHRSHAYQVGAAATSHPAVVKQIAMLNVLLIVLAFIAASPSTSASISAGCTAIASAATVALFAWFQTLGRC
jgi:hypothetical protein